MARVHRVKTIKKTIVPSAANIRIVYRDLDELVPYNRNPRDNAQAVPVIQKAIREFGFLVPIVVGSDNVIAAGHTRYLAAKAEGMTSVPTITADHLTPAQLQAFRVSDNKVSEIAKWNTEYLAMEMAEIVASGIDMASLGFTENEIDCLADMVSDDCLSAGSAVQEPEDTPNTVNPRSPANTRLVIGEFVLFIRAEVYKRWAAAVRTENEFNAEAINIELKRRLGIEEFDR